MFNLMHRYQAIAVAAFAVGGLFVSPARGAVMIYNLGTLGGSDSEGDAINVGGQVAGSSATAGDLVGHAFRYTDTPGSGGVMADLGTLDHGAVSYGYGINASGQVAGFSYIDTDNGDYHAF